MQSIQGRHAPCRLAQENLGNLMQLCWQNPEQAVYVCQHVFEGTRSMDYIFYDHDSDILITCSGQDHELPC